MAKSKVGNDMRVLLHPAKPCNKPKIAVIIFSIVKDSQYIYTIINKVCQRRNIMLMLAYNYCIKQLILFAYRDNDV